MYELQTPLPSAGTLADEEDCKGNCPPQESYPP
jgi:hypothetical protein